VPFVPSSSRGGGGGGLASLGSVAPLAAPAATIQVTGITATATTLMVVAGGLISTAAALTDSVNVRLNSDAGAAHYGEGPAGTAWSAGFTTSWQGTIPAATMNAEGGFVMFIYGYTAAGQVVMTVTSGGRFALGGANTDFSQGSSNGVWTGPGPVTSITLTPTTGPNFSAGGYLNVYGL
jgi:hypothetical protein